MLQKITHSTQSNTKIPLCVRRNWSKFANFMQQKRRKSQCTGDLRRFDGGHFDSNRSIASTSSCPHKDITINLQRYTSASNSHADAPTRTTSTQHSKIDSISFVCATMSVDSTNNIKYNFVSFWIYRYISTDTKWKPFSTFQPQFDAEQLCCCHIESRRKTHKVLEGVKWQKISYLLFSLTLSPLHFLALHICLSFALCLIQSIDVVSCFMGGTISAVLTSNCLCSQSDARTIWSTCSSIQKYIFSRTRHHNAMYDVFTGSHILRFKCYSIFQRAILTPWSHTHTCTLSACCRASK